MQPSYNSIAAPCRSCTERPIAADDPLVEGQFFPAHLAQRQDAFATNAVLLAAMDQARLRLQPDADVRGKPQMRQHQRAIGGRDQAAGRVWHLAPGRALRMPLPETVSLGSITTIPARPRTADV